MSEPKATGSYPRKSLHASDRMGVYEELDKVPDQYRLYHHADAYAGRDTWQAFCEAEEYAQGNDEHVQEVDRVGDRWKAFMAERGRHHALATPADVDAWCDALRDRFSQRRAFEHWIRVNRFYDWLQWHAEHPHRYNPAMMAAANGEVASALWEYWKMMLRERRIANAGEPPDREAEPTEAQ